MLKKNPWHLPNSVKANTVEYAKEKKLAKKGGTVLLSVDDLKLGWLNGFTEVIQALLAVDSKVTLDSNSDEIEGYLLQVKNI